jgi:hypothetical protein
MPVARARDIQPEAEVDTAHSALRDEARRIAADPDDRAELTALRKELDELIPAWPAD